MRDAEGHECPVSHEAIEARLQHAFITVSALPPDSPKRLKAASYGYVTPMAPGEATRHGETHLAPSARDITLMDAALFWPSLIENVTVRKIVSARSVMKIGYDGYRVHACPWRRLATTLKADAMAIRRWHKEGIEIIAGFLRHFGA